MPLSRSKVLDLDAAVAFRARLRAEHRTLVFTNGCYDVLHPGHVQLLADARALGSALIVGINSDDSTRRLKGPERPVFPEAERAETLAALQSVDAVVVFAEDTPERVVSALVPDVLVKGEDWGAGEIVGRSIVEAAGGRVVRVPLVPGFATSAIVAAARAGGTPLGPRTGQ